MRLLAAFAATLSLVLFGQPAQAQGLTPNGQVTLGRCNTSSPYALCLHEAPGGQWLQIGSFNPTSHSFTIPNSILAPFPATTILGNNTGSSASPLYLTPAQVAAMINQPYRVLPNTQLSGPDGKRFVIHGDAMFDYLFESFEFRGYSGGVPINQTYRQILNPAGKGPGTGISEPTYYARVQYKNAANVNARLKAAAAAGVNTIRIGVEPAMALASVSYVDPNDGLTYPPDFTMLDTIINTAAQYNILVVLTQANDSIAISDNTTFMTTLATRYLNYKNVAINPGNEINSAPYQTSAGVFIANPYFNDFNTDANGWVNKETTYINAIRATGFTGLIFVNPPQFAARFDLAAAYVAANAPFNSDGGIVYGIHVYAQAVSGSGASLVVENNWQQTGLLNYGNNNFVESIGTVPMIIEEVGINNNLGGTPPPNYDPNLNGASVSLTAWAQMQNWAVDFLSWANQVTINGKLSGVIGTMDLGYFPGTATYDNNSAHYTNGTLTTWGKIQQAYNWAPVTTLTNVPTNDPVNFGALGFRNYLINANGQINQRGFAGGALAANTFGYDMWKAPTASTTTVSVSASGVWSLNSGGFIRQVIENPNFQCQTVTVSVENPSVGITVYLGNASNPAQYALGIAAGPGKQWNTFYLPCTGGFTTGNMVFTIQASGGAVTYQNPQVEIGLVPTPFDHRPQGVEWALAQRYYAKLSGTMSTSLTTFNPVYYLPVLMAVTPTLGTPTLNAGTGAAFATIDARTVYQSVANSAASGFALFADADLPD